MKTILINGSSGVGKDEMLKYLDVNYNCLISQWSDKGKQISASLGIRDDRTELSRKALSNLILYLDAYNISLDHIVSCRAKSNKRYHIITFRTSEQLEALKMAFNDIVSVKINRDVEVPNNYADKSVKDVVCDYTIDNNSTMGNFYYNITEFMKCVL